ERLADLSRRRALAGQESLARQNQGAGRTEVAGEVRRSPRWELTRLMEGRTPRPPAAISERAAAGRREPCTHSHEFGCPTLRGVRSVGTTDLNSGQGDFTAKRERK